MDESWPNLVALHNAVRYIRDIGRKPSNVVCEPAGGLIVDWRLGPAVLELTFYNSGKIEYMVMLHGKVLALIEI